MFHLIMYCTIHLPNTIFRTAGGTDTLCMMEESMHSAQSIEEDSAVLQCFGKLTEQ